MRRLVWLAIAAACAHGEPVPTPEPPPPPPPPPQKTCDRHATPREQLAFHDPEHAQLVDDALGRATVDHPIRYQTTFSVTNEDLTATVTATERLQEVCYDTEIYGYAVSASLSGPAAARYELVGVTGWDGVIAETLAHGEHDDWVSFWTTKPTQSQHVGVTWRDRQHPDATFVAAAELVVLQPIPTRPHKIDAPCDEGMAHVVDVLTQPPRLIWIGADEAREHPATLPLFAWIETDETITPSATTDFGTIQRAHIWRHGAYGFEYDPRCPDGTILPRRATITVRMELPTHATVTGTLDVDISPTGAISTVGTPAHPIIQMM